MPEQQEGPPDVSTIFGALSRAFSLNRREQALLLRILWVLVVSAHIAWACGWLAVFGLVGFARGDDVTEIKNATKAAARITLSKEIREQNHVRCLTTDQIVIDSITRYIDSLQFEYERITGSRYPEAACPHP